MHAISQVPEPTGGQSGPPQPPGAGIARAEVRIRGQAFSLHSAQIDGLTVFGAGRWLKVAAVRDEELVEGDTVGDPEAFLSRLRSSGLKADLFTFAQRLPDTKPRHAYHIEWENAAALPIISYEHWWKEQTEYSIRKGVNKAKKLGVVVRVAEFNTALVEAICRIYNETPVRQGKAFWHYQKDFQSVEHALATYLDRSTFIGAYCEDELIGFIKMTRVNSASVITQILSAKRHFDKRPNNALIAKAVELCEADRRSHFVYGSFVYYDPDSSLTEFKRRNGFESIPLPRYYVPLTVKGKLALKLGLHRELPQQVPPALFRQFLKARKLWYARRSGTR
jgi:hypothetical protein